MNNDNRKAKIEIGLRIKELRIKLGMSQEDLAKAIGYKSENSRSTINKVEMGINDVTQSKLPLYAKALNTSVPFLLGIEGSVEEVSTSAEQKRNVEWEIQ